jgi:hypothetical protein
MCILNFHKSILQCTYWTSTNQYCSLHIGFGLSWLVTRRRTWCSSSCLYLQRHFVGYPRRIACPAPCVKECKEGRARFYRCPGIPSSRHAGKNTTNGLKYLLRWRGFFIKPDFICRRCQHIMRVCGMLQILVSFTKSPPIHWNKGAMLCCHVLAYLTPFSSIRQSYQIFLYIFQTSF